MYKIDTYWVKTKITSTYIQINIKLNNKYNMFTKDYWGLKFVTRHWFALSSRLELCSGNDLERWHPGNSFEINYWLPLILKAIPKSTLTSPPCLFFSWKIILDKRGLTNLQESWPSSLSFILIPSINWPNRSVVYVR